MAASSVQSALAPAQGNNKLFTVATFNVGAKNPESFLNKKGVPHAGFSRAAFMLKLVVF